MRRQGGGTTRQAVLAAFRQQIGWCESLGSPFTAGVLTHLAEDLAAGGLCAELLDDWPGDPVTDALALRMAGALHALALAGASPDLAASYAKPAMATPGRLAEVLPRVLAEQRDVIAAFLASPPQTNEVARSGVLVGGFLQVAEVTGLPLRLLEIGASAGLNSIWDRFHYRLGASEWGDPASPVRLTPDWSGPPPPVGAPVRIVERRACDLAPVDLEEAAQRLRLRAYVWPDQTERLARLDAAIVLARAAGSRVEQADAAAWVRERLQDPPGPHATVLYHSIMWQYLPAPTRAEIKASLEAAGHRATAEAPLAWLRFEPSAPEQRPELRLSLWPGLPDMRLAVADPHGRGVAWSGA